jgi:VWFA-related protein
MRERPSRFTCPRRFLLIALAVSGVVASGLAQPPPRFRTQVEAVPLDIIVVDRDGRPVPDLGPADFSVTVDGQARNVVSAEFLSSAAAGAAPRAPDAPRWDIDEAFDQAYLDNQRALATDRPRSRTIVIAIDQSSFSTAAGRTAALAARGLLDMLHPDDRIGLVAFPPPGPSVPPTRDHQRVRAALGQVTGSAESMPRTEIGLTVTDALGWLSGDGVMRDQVMSRSCPVSAGTDSCRADLDSSANHVANFARRQTQITRIALENVVRAVGSRGTPSVIVVVSNGIYGAVRGSQGVDDELRVVARAASDTRATLYGLYVESGFLDRDSLDRRQTPGFSNADGDLRLDGLRNLAGLAGGTVMRVAPGNDEGFRRVSLELSAYYLLGFEGLPTDRDGRRHRIRVQVRRPGVSVRAREDLYLPAIKKLSGADAVREALSEPTVVRDLPIRLATQMMREPGTDKVRLIISALIGQGAKASAPVLVAYRLRGAGAAGTAGASEVQTLELPVVGTGAVASWAFVETAALTPGRYLLRLAAADEGNRLGSVEQVVDATLVGGAAGAMSDVLLIDPSRGVKETFAPVGDGRVTGDAVQAFVEVYPARGQAVETVRFDISDTPGGPAVVGGTVKPERGKDRLTAGISFELGGLPQGTYMMNARVMDGERVLVRASRPFRVERPAGTLPAGPRAAFAFADAGGVVKPFERGDALRPDAIGYFLGRLRETDGAGTDRPAVGSAAAALRNSRFDEALKLLAAESGDALAVTFIKGLALFGQGQLEAAAAEFRSALRLSNDFLPAAFYLGACYAAGGRDREAVGAWQTSLVSEADSRIVYEVLADAWLRLKEAGRAQAVIAEAGERWPGDDVFAPRLAATMVLLNRRADALAALEPFIERHPLEAEPIFLAIRLLYEAFDAGKPVKGGAADRALVLKYRDLYVAAAGSSQALVGRWVGAMTK